MCCLHKNYIFNSVPMLTDQKTKVVPGIFLVHPKNIVISQKKCKKFFDLDISYATYNFRNKFLYILFYE